MAPCVSDMESVGVLQAFVGHVRIFERAKLKYEIIICIFMKHSDGFLPLLSYLTIRIPHPKIADFLSNDIPPNRESR